MKKETMNYTAPAIQEWVVELERGLAQSGMENNSLNEYSEVDYEDDSSFWL